MSKRKISTTVPVVITLICLIYNETYLFGALNKWQPSQFLKVNASMLLILTWLVVLFVWLLWYDRREE